MNNHQQFSVKLLQEIAYHPFHKKNSKSGPKHLALNNPGGYAMRFSGALLYISCLFLISSAAPFAAETSDSPSALPKTVAVAAFKNGLAFVLRQGEVPLSSGVGRITPIPNATLGSLWISPNTPGSKLDEVVA
jgi:hypothetical protein